MQMQKACYSISKLNKAAEMVKAINWTVKRKNEHFAKWQEIKAVFQYASDNINYLLFDPDFVLKRYMNMAYNFKGYHKKDIDQELRYIYRYICNELNGIKTMIAAGEVDSTD